MSGIQFLGSKSPDSIFGEKVPVKITNNVPCSIYMVYYGQFQYVDGFDTLFSEFYRKIVLLFMYR